MPSELGLKPEIGAVERGNKWRLLPADRPSSRYAAIALPTSSGSGSRHSRPPLLRTRRCPRSQSQSSSCKVINSWLAFQAVPGSRGWHGRAAQSPAEVATCDRPLGVVGRDRPWKRRRGRRVATAGTAATSSAATSTVLTEVQERSHGGDDAFEAGRPQMSRLAANEIDDVAGDVRQSSRSRAIATALACFSRIVRLGAQTASLVAGDCSLLT